MAPFLCCAGHNLKKNSRWIPTAIKPKTTTSAPSELFGVNEIRIVIIMTIQHSIQFLLFSLIQVVFVATRGQNITTGCQESGLQYCDDPSNLVYEDVECDPSTCLWLIDSMTPTAIPAFCIEQNVTIDNPFVVPYDWQEPCLLWEIFFGQYTNDTTQAETPNRSQNPAAIPSSSPTQIPSISTSPSLESTRTWTSVPSDLPTLTPTHMIFSVPSTVPSALPSTLPSASNYPTSFLSTMPSTSTSLEPTRTWTSMPSNVPTLTPTYIISSVPSRVPSAMLSSLPSASNYPTSFLSSMPSIVSTITIAPTNIPSASSSKFHFGLAVDSRHWAS